MKAIKQTYNNLDLYGSPVFIQQLKNTFANCSYRLGSIPGDGSPSYKTKQLNDNFEVQRAIFHKDNTITIKTKHGYLHFF